MPKRLLRQLLWLPAVAAVGCATTSTNMPEVTSAIEDGSSRWYTQTAARPTRVGVGSGETETHSLTLAAATEPVPPNVAVNWMLADAWVR